jgi:formate hydrogenlyase subunit 6/NADH:ubiquinone oxidoreductase subunit I
MAQMSFGKVISRSVLSRPATRLYPFEKRPFYKATRGAVGIDVEKCIMCSICQKRCPTDAITVTKANKDWQINRLRCISCGACVDACPKKCLWLENAYSPAVVLKGPDDKFHQADKPKTEETPS